MPTKITKISTKNVKGNSTAIYLTGADLIIGANGAGKTALLRALMIGLLGFDPALGNQAGKTMAAASSDAMSVDLALDGAEITAISRKFKKNADGKCSQSVSVFPSVDGERSGAEQAIQQKLGCEPAMVDLAEFMGLSAAKQREFLFGLIGDVGAGQEKPIGEMIRERLAGDEAAAALVNEALAKPAIAKIENVVDMVFSLLAWLKDAATEVSADERKSQAGANKITELKNAEGQFSKGIAVCRAEIDAANAGLRKLEADRARADEQRKLFERNQKRLAKLKADAAAIPARIEAEEKELGEIQARRKSAEVALPEIAELIEAVNNGAQQIERLLGVQGIIEKARVAGNGACPLAAENPCPVNLDAAYETNKFAIGNLRSGAEALKKQIAEISTTFDGPVYAMASGLQELILWLHAKATDAEQHISNDKTLFGEAVTEITELEKLGEGPGIVEDENIAMQIASFEAQIKENDGIISAREQHKRDMILAEQCLESASAASKRLAAIKAVQAAVGPKGVLGAMLLAAKTQILGAANEFCQTILPNYEIDFSETADIGVKKDGGDWVIPLRLLSNGESTIILAGLRIVVMLLKQAPLKVLIVDNIEAIDERATTVPPLRRALFVQACVGLQRNGKVGNVLMAGVEGPCVGTEGLNTIQMGA